MRWIDTPYRRSWPCRAAVLALALSAGAGATENPATDAAARRVTEAEALAERAYAAYVVRDYAAAVALYHQAFERAPSADALFNIARIYDFGLRDRSLAMSFYRRYLGDPGALPERIQRANQRLAELRLAEQAELAPLPSPRASGTAPVPATAETATAGGLSSVRIAALATGAVGAVAAGVGAAFGMTVLSDARRANDDCNGDRCRSQVGLDAADAASRHATLATWGIAAGAGLMASGALLWVLDPGADVRDADVRVDPVAGASELGLALSGKW